MLLFYFFTVVLQRHYETDAVFPLNESDILTFPLYSVGYVVEGLKSIIESNPNTSFPNNLSFLERDFIGATNRIEEYFRILEVYFPETYETVRVLKLQYDALFDNSPHIFGAGISTNSVREILSKTISYLEKKVSEETTRI